MCVRSGNRSLKGLLSAASFSWVALSICLAQGPPQLLLRSDKCLHCIGEKRPPAVALGISGEVP